ncbi:RDD family protein [Cytophagaceae bacterium ABcell3]|nr:RDD family protein [Cytophagaceae bacterium ABcell3]
MRPENIYVVDSDTPASPGERVVAFLIDYAIGGGLWFIPYVGVALSTLYLLTRDGLPFLKHRSVGKIILNQQVIHNHSRSPGLKTSLKRNFIFIHNIITAIPVVGEEFAYLVLSLNLLAFAIESFLMFTHSDHQRLGDQFANTHVVKYEQ